MMSVISSILIAAAALLSLLALVVPILLVTSVAADLSRAAFASLRQQAKACVLRASLQQSR